MIYRPISRGYIALMSALILSSILAIFVFSTGTHAFLVRSGILDTEEKIESDSLAKSCASVALLSYAKDQTYTVPISRQQVSIDATKMCTIDSISTTTTGITILTHASVSGSYSRLLTNATSMTATYPFAIQYQTELINTQQ